MQVMNTALLLLNMDPAKQMILLRFSPCFITMPMDLFDYNSP